jgi:hypothetical protein
MKSMAVEREPLFPFVVRPGLLGIVTVWAVDCDFLVTYVFANTLNFFLIEPPAHPTYHVGTPQGWKFTTTSQTCHVAGDHGVE